MARLSLFDRYESFVAAAVLAVHANSVGRGFRQHDVRVFIELFTSWVDSMEEYPALPVQNNQIARYLDRLADEGFARKLTRQGKPLYRLTRTGLIEIISRLIQQSHFTRTSHFYFVYYMTRSYRSRIIDLVKREGERFPYSMQLELEGLLDIEALVDRQVDYVQREVRKLEKRIDEQIRVKTTVDAMVERRAPFAELTGEVDRLSPFGVDTFRRSSEVLRLGTEKQALWELQVGGPRRAGYIWEPARKMLLLHLEELQKLKEEARAISERG